MVPSRGTKSEPLGCRHTHSYTSRFGSLEPKCNTFWLEDNTENNSTSPYLPYLESGIIYIFCLFIMHLSLSIYIYIYIYVDFSFHHLTLASLCITRIRSWQGLFAAQGEKKPAFALGRATLVSFVIGSGARLRKGPGSRTL